MPTKWCSAFHMLVYILMEIRAVCNLSHDLQMNAFLLICLHELVASICSSEFNMDFRASSCCWQEFYNITAKNRLFNSNKYSTIQLIRFLESN